LSLKIVIAPDSFKESLSAPEVADEIEAGFREIFPDSEYLKFPMADGGEGTVAAMVAATRGQIVKLPVTGPLGEKVAAFYGITGDGKSAIIEMAAASGLHLVAPGLRNPLITTSYGSGELILAALDAGLRDFIIGIGGSATNDGGAGMLQALGVKLLDAQGRQISFGGEALARLERIDFSGFDPRIKQCRIQVACDVDNPLCGIKGAAQVFGPQKGATPEMVAQLDSALAHFGRLIHRDLQRDVANMAGAGAAGGMGAALLAFLDAQLKPGIDMVIQATGLEDAMRHADLVITGEGRMDAQSTHGKAPVGVARVAAGYGVPVIGICGSLGDGADLLTQHGIAAFFSVVNGPCTLQAALEDAARNIRDTARNVAAVLALGKRLAERTRS
jgi:glycerate kinase